MNNKIIILSALIILVVVSIGFYLWNNFASNTAANIQNIVLSSSIKGCAETDKGEATKSMGETGQEPKIEMIGNQIKYSRAINHLCCRKAEIEKETSGFTINIFEDWSGPGCKCTCFSRIEATLNNVPPGSYTINVYEKGIKPGDGEIMERKLIITQYISVN